VRLFQYCNDISPYLLSPERQIDGTDHMGKVDVRCTSLEYTKEVAAIVTAGICLSKPGSQTYAIYADSCQRAAFVLLETEDVPHAALLPTRALDCDA
jgi:hypothetical protein